MRASLFGAILLVAASARADDPVADDKRAAERSPPTTTRWYGWQTLAVDAATIGSAFVLLGAGSPEGGIGVGVTGYLVGGPTVHALHAGGGGRAGRSVLLRLGVPALGALVGYEVAGFDWFCGPDAPADSDIDAECREAQMIDALVGAGIGAGLAVILDAVLLGRERVVHERAGVSLVWMPQGDGMTVGLAGSW